MMQEVILSPDFSQQLTEIKALIEKRLKTPLALQSALQAHWFKRQGKAIRAQLVLASAACQSPEVIQLAAIVELLHAATLLHDDVMDHATERRDQTAAHLLFGNHASILGGDYLYSIAFQMISELKNHDMNAILSKATSAIVSGEIRQLQCTHMAQLNPMQSFRIIKGKTARLFATACHLGALSSRQTHLAPALSRFGHCFGMAYQLSDDILDYIPNDALGKPHGNDLREGKPTLPFVFAYQQADAAQAEKLSQALHQKDQITEAHLAWIAKHGIQPTLKIAKRYLKMSHHALSTLPKARCTYFHMLTDKIHQRLALID